MRKTVALTDPLAQRVRDLAAAHSPAKGAGRKPVGSCWACDGQLEPFGVVVRGGVRVRRGGVVAKLGPVCLTCYLGPVPRFIWMARVANPTRPGACANCGQVVVREGSKLPAWFACSAACAVALGPVPAPPRTGPAPKRCVAWGEPMAGSRPDRLYCSGRCARRVRQASSLDRSRGRLCTFPGCGRAWRSSGLCSSHYRQRQSGRELAPIRSYGQPRGVCVFAGCGRKARSATNGLCRAHANQEREGHELRPITARARSSASGESEGGELTPPER